MFETCKLAGRGRVLPPFSSNCFQLYPDRASDTPEGDDRAVVGVCTGWAVFMVRMEEGDEVVDEKADGGGIKPAAADADGPLDR